MFLAHEYGIKRNVIHTIDENFSNVMKGEDTILTEYVPLNSMCTYHLQPYCSLRNVLENEKHYPILKLISRNKRS
jgi:hypothetical protein